MAARDQGLLVAVAIAAVVAVLAAAAAAFAVVRTQRDRRRIAQLQAQVRTLCGRKMVTGVTVTRTGSFSVQTARGC